MRHFAELDDKCEQKLTVQVVVLLLVGGVPDVGEVLEDLRPLVLDDYGLEQVLLELVLLVFQVHFQLLEDVVENHAFAADQIDLLLQPKHSECISGIDLPLDLRERLVVLLLQLVDFVLVGLNLLHQRHHLL